MAKDKISSKASRLFRQGRGQGIDDIPANGNLDVTFTVDNTANDAFYVPIYAGNGNCIITNIWTSSATEVKATIHNLLSEALWIETNSFVTIGRIKR